MTQFIRTLTDLLERTVRLAVAAALCGSALCAAQATPPANAAPDVLVLSDGDTLHGNLVSEVAGKVTFHTDSLGDVTLAWDKIKELHTAEPFAVLDSTAKVHGKKAERQIPIGKVEATSETVTVQPENGAAPAPIPLKNAQYIMDAATLTKQIEHEPNFLEGWNGAATAGATLVSATENQYTVSGAVSLVRVVPTGSWLDTRNRTSTDFSESFGKITQPAYTLPGPPPTLVAAQTIKSSILHIDAERDQYFSPRAFALVQTAFDHNFAQDLQLQQIYGAGFGWTVLKSPKHELDLKGTMQYEKQAFIANAGSSPSPSQNLVGSTFAASYMLHQKLFTYTQELAFIPAYNIPSDYSAAETNTLVFPVFKSLGFSVGTLDTYLNDPPVAAEPPTRRNSFQFTMGLSYAIKSKY